MFSLTVLNAVERSAYVTGYNGATPLREIEMGPHGVSKIVDAPLTPAYAFSNAAPIKLKLQIYVPESPYLRALLFPEPETANAKNAESTFSIAAVEEGELDYGATEDRINRVKGWIDTGEILPVWEEVKPDYFAPTTSDNPNIARFSWDLRTNISNVNRPDGKPHYVDDTFCYVLRNAETDEILHVAGAEAYALIDAFKSGKSIKDTNKGVVTLSYFFAMNIPTRIHFFLLRSSALACVGPAMEDFNDGFEGMYNFFTRKSCGLVAYKKDVIITEPFTYTELDWDVTTPDGKPFVPNSSGEWTWVIMWEAASDYAGPALTPGQNLAYIVAWRKALPNPTGAYTGAIRPYDVNGYLDEQCDKYPQYCNSAVNEIKENARVVAGYYNTLGQKLPQEPQSGIYIIVYDNGKTEKMVR